MGKVIFRGWLPALSLAKRINVNHHSVAQVYDELISSFKIFVFIFIGSLMFQRKYYKKNRNGVDVSTHNG